MVEVTETSNIADTCFAVLAVNGQKRRFLGSAFLIDNEGGLMTCRHVVEGATDDDQLAILHVDNRSGERRVNLLPAKKVIYPEDDSLDLAFLPEAVIDVESRVPFPLGDEPWILMGIDAHTFGYTTGRDSYLTEIGYYAGPLVARRHADLSLGGHESIVLGFSIIEGVSGSPLLSSDSPDLTRRVIGICCGNESRRILAHEVVTTDSGDTQVREEIHRLVEQGLAIPIWVIVEFLHGIGVVPVNP